MMAQAVGGYSGSDCGSRTDQFGAAPLYVVEGGYLWANDAGDCIS